MSWTPSQNLQKVCTLSLMLKSITGLFPYLVFVIDDHPEEIPEECDIRFFKIELLQCFCEFLQSLVCLVT